MQLVQLGRHDAPLSAQRATLEADGDLSPTAAQCLHIDADVSLTLL